MRPPVISKFDGALRCSQRRRSRRPSAVCSAARPSRRPASARRAEGASEPGLRRHASSSSAARPLWAARSDVSAASTSSSWVVVSRRKRARAHDAGPRARELREGAPERRRLRAPGEPHRADVLEVQQLERRGVEGREPRVVDRAELAVETSGLAARVVEENAREGEIEGPLRRVARPRLLRCESVAVPREALQVVVPEVAPVGDHETACAVTPTRGGVARDVLEAVRHAREEAVPARRPRAHPELDSVRGEDLYEHRRFRVRSGSTSGYGPLGQVPSGGPWAGASAHPIVELLQS